MERFNPWWQNEEDENIAKWKQKEIKWRPEIIKNISLEPFSLHFLTGPRQIGKTTSIKILINDLLNKNVNPNSIFYYQCDELVDFRELGEILDNYYDIRTHWKIKKSLIFLDEITFVRDWWRAIKARIDNNQFKNDVIVITGSASIDLLKEKERFPGRRGHGQDLVLLPLSFNKYIKLFEDLKSKQIEINGNNDFLEEIKVNRIFSSTFSKIFSSYLISGGFPLSIIDYIKYGKINESTKKTYLDWLKSDWQKQGKTERYMKEVISYLIQTRLSPISWLSIAKNTSINSPHTTEKYVNTLENIHAVNVVYQISPNFKINYRKNKKIHFLDPFIYKLMAEYTRNEILTETIVESVVVNHLNRKFPTYFWKNNTEIDVICLINDKQVGFEVKWGPKNWRKPKHLKNATLLTKDIIPLFLSSYNFN
ncbi:MAG: ATP-binding protein [Candidatus Helarchaeota archaeon]